MTSTGSLIPLDVAQSFVLDRIEPLSPIALPLLNSSGLVLAVDIESHEDIPPFKNTASDGYAVRAKDTTGASKMNPVRLKVIATIAAGDSIDPTLEPGTAVRIMTGAPVPLSADSIVMVEDTALYDDQPSMVQVFKQASPGDSIREAGSDISTGQVVLLAGTVLNPAAIGVLASLGYKKVPVYPRPKVGVISTGSELVDTGDVSKGMIRDSNRPSLIEAVNKSGFEAIDLGIVPDDAGQLEEAFTRAAKKCDAIITSGGVSVGDFDLTKEVLAKLSEGGMRWMQVAIKPAKPFAFGKIAGTPLFGLPGNPVSALVSFELFARPAIRKLMNYPSPYKTLLNATLQDDVARRKDGKVHFLRAVCNSVNGELQATLKLGQKSHMLSQMASANALLVVPDGNGFQAGAKLPVILLDQ